MLEESGPAWGDPLQQFPPRGASGRVGAADLATVPGSGPLATKGGPAARALPCSRAPHQTAGGIDHKPPLNLQKPSKTMSKRVETGRNGPKKQKKTGVHEIGSKKRHLEMTLKGPPAPEQAAEPDARSARAQPAPGNAGRGSAKHQLYLAPAAANNAKTHLWKTLWKSP